MRRVSGTADYVVEKVASDGVVFNETWRVDGNSSGSAKIKLLKDDMTYCRKGHCRIDRETSGLVFNPLLWGDPPANLHAGVTWAATISRPWEIGPPGVEHVRVLRADPVNHQVTLVREGSGDGKSLDDQRLKTITITTSTGKSIKVSVIPGKTHWSGYTTICNGIIVGDEIMVERDVTLVTQSGTRFHGKQRAYTLLNLASDIMPNKHHG
ncbi:MAG TPA: hypothetical protein VFM97_05805 [Gammaproteobacteria bacterium]|nr:hypothetical protein [Gammaproteobacteria bacterium]